MSFCVNRYVFPLSGLLQALLILLSFCLSIRLFCCVFLVDIFLSKIFRFLLHPVVDMFLCHLFPVVSRIFLLFRNVLFCLYCFTLCRYPFILPSFASTFWYISSSCFAIFSFITFFFLFLHVPASFLRFTILTCFRRFFYLRFQSNFPSWFRFFIRAFSGDPDFITS